MKLPPFLSSAKKDKTDIPILALQIGPQFAKAAAWKLHKDEIEIQSVVKGITPEEVLRKITETYPSRHVLFGLPADYIEHDTIKDERLPELKRISEAFSLAPLGFVVVAEAIANFLETEQGSPQTAILASISQQKLSFSLFRVGKLFHTVSTNRGDNLITDFEKGLLQFTEEEVLPSKILIDCDDPTVENIKEELLNYPWQDNDKFLHVPKIELLPWEYSIQAIVQSGVGEIDQEALLNQPAEDELKSDTVGQTDDQPISYATNGSVAHLKAEEIDEPFEDYGQKKAYPSSAVIKTSASDFGFSLNPTRSMPISQPVHIKEEISPKTMPNNTTSSHASLKISNPLRKWSMSNFSALPFPKNISLPQPHGLLPAASGIAILLIAFASLAVLYPKSTITLLVEPDIIEDEVAIKLNPNTTDVNGENGEIPGKVHSVTVSTTKTGKATGTKTIGEKASGKIALYNKSASQKTFSKGTVLGTSDVKFTLNEDVTVASASDTGDSLKYGKSTTGVTAISIGPEGNIDNEVELTIDDVSETSAIARSEEQFTGGTEREINVVSEEDHDGLLENVLEELKTQAREQLAGLIGDNETYLEESLSENVVEQSFDADIGEETDIVSLDMVVEIAQTSYATDDINKLLESYMKERIKNGYTLDLDKSYFRVVDSTKDENGNVTFTANVHAFLIPEIALDHFNDSIAGISERSLESHIGSLTDQNIIGYEITKDRSLPFLSSRLPFLAKNIDIEIEVYE